jgi:hypothetical protein
MNPIRKAVLGSVFAGATLVGAGFGATVLSGTSASAQTATTTASDSSTTAPAASTDASAAPAADPGPRSGQPPKSGSFDPAKGGHVGANGTKEELLTGDVADKVTAAANGAVAGGTIQRVENDAEGATYEAHMTTADGKQVTVKVNADFSVASVEDGAK